MPTMFSEADIQHVLRMVLNDNRGNTLTEALGLGIESSVLHYLKQINMVAANAVAPSFLGEGNG